MNRTDGSRLGEPRAFTGRMSVENLENLARRQNLMREVNERIHQLRWAQSDGETIGYLCECSLVDCAETVPLGADAYDAVRGSPLRFLLLSGHECREVEQVVERHPDYTVVENVGEAAEIARRADPRTSS